MVYNKHIDLVISRSHAAKMDWVDPTAQHMAVRHSTYDLPFSRLQQKRTIPAAVCTPSDPVSTLMFIVFNFHPRELSTYLADF